MNNIANTTTLWQLLGKCNVVIPILQRDYAQGRVGYENLREKFLSAILAALDGDKLLHCCPRKSINICSNTL